MKSDGVWFHRFLYQKKEPEQKGEYDVIYDSGLL